MENTLHPLTQWVIDKIKTQYPQDIALLVAVEGHSVNGDGHGEPFDYFVPATEAGNALAQTFIIGGVGNDLYPRSWERCQRTASLDDWASICLGNGKLLYSRSQQDAERFEALRQQLFTNLNDPVFVYKKALERLDSAMDMYRTMMFEDRLYKVRGLVGFIHFYLAMGVAYLNKTYIGAGGWSRGLLTEYAGWPARPKGFVEHYESIVAAKTVGELRSLAHLLIVSARQFMAEYRPQGPSRAKPEDVRGLADWYQELRTTWNRIDYYCDIRDSNAAFHDACSLQNELNVISEEFDLFYSFNVGDRFGLCDMDLLGAFDAQDLEPLRQRARELEQAIVHEVERHGVEIRRYDTLEAFLSEAK